jgi:hypothetical protein
MKKYYIAAILGFILLAPSAAAFAQGHDTISTDEITVEAKRPKNRYEARRDSIIAASNIEKVKITTTPCFGTCPVFTAEFNNDEIAFFNGEQYTKLEGKYKARFYSIFFSEICEYIKLVDFEKLNEQYSAPIADLPTTKIEIFYKDGSVISVKDYGYAAPVAFHFLVTYLRYMINDALKWEKVEE